MTTLEIIALVVTIVSMLCFSTVFTLLFSSYVKTSSEEIITGKKDIELLDTVLIEKRNINKKHKKFFDISKKISSFFILGILAITVCSSLYSKITNDMTPIFDTTVLTIKTGSMSYKHESNTYLTAHNLNDQFNAFDMIFIHEVDSEDELSLYDVIAFRNDQNTIIIHRIVEIFEEDGVINYRTRGDANARIDAGTRTYEDIVGVYNGKRVPVLGIFVIFLQSYSGMVTIVALIYCIWMFSSQYNKFKKVCDERSSLLLSLLIDPNDINELKTTYIQYIYYRDNIYEFNDGKFVRIGNKKLNDDNNIYFVSKKENETIIDAKNIVDDKIVDLSNDQKINTIENIKNQIKE